MYVLLAWWDLPGGVSIVLSVSLRRVGSSRRPGVGIGTHVVYFRELGMSGVPGKQCALWALGLGPFGDSGRQCGTRIGVLSLPHVGRC